MLTLYEICCEWFNGTSREDWDTWFTMSDDEIRIDIEGAPDLEGYSIPDIRETMIEIIAVYDELNADRKDD